MRIKESKTVVVLSNIHCTAVCRAVVNKMLTLNTKFSLDVSIDTIRHDDSSLKYYLDTFWIWPQNLACSIIT